MTSIEWTDETWNPLAGCTRASAGCDNCYAARMALRLEAMAQADIAAGKDPGGKTKYIGVATRNGRGVPAFNGTINLDTDALNVPLNWRKPRRVFVNSMSDLFHPGVPFRFVADAFTVMRLSPRHTYQVLTKRPGRMADFQRQHYPNGFPANVWAMTSVENQAAADERIPDLLRVRAAVRGLSMEPLLGPVNIGFGGVMPNRWQWLDGDSLHWVIVGGESGPNARPMHPDWVRSIRDQCQAAGVPFFFKQWGDWCYPSQMTDGERRAWDVYHGTENVEERPAALGKKRAGRLLDGREWNEYPEVTIP